jgi:hypothetical protein
MYSLFSNVQFSCGLCLTPSLPIHRFTPRADQDHLHKSLERDAVSAPNLKVAEVPAELVQTFVVDSQFAHAPSSLFPDVA